MGRKRKSPEKPKKGLGRRAKKQQPPVIPDYLKEAKGSLVVLCKATGADARMFEHRVRLVVRLEFGSLHILAVRTSACSHFTYGQGEMKLSTIKCGGEI